MFGVLGLYNFGSSCKSCIINVGKKWTLQMLIPQYLVLVLKLTPINTVSLNTVFSIPQNQCYLGNTCIWYAKDYDKIFSRKKDFYFKSQACKQGQLTGASNPGF